jgi:TonB-linked SusC/RagA family outer membrane protein
LGLIAKTHIAYMKKIVLMVLVSFLTLGIWAQNKNVTGQVTDEAGAPLEGVSVIIKGNSKGTQTNKEGKFVISIPASGSVVNFSYIGYKSVTKSVNSSNVILVKLEKNNANLDEVVVIGYQSIKRKDLLASVASVSAKDLKDIPVNSAAEALNGRLAGVTATSAEGSPDAAIRIRVRGGMSITSDNSPLYIVDGVQVENGLSAIAPQDIQSIDVLKDAAATAIYGARGGNGVILITTKGGRKGKMQVSYNGFYGVKELSKRLDVLSPFDYVFYQSERSRGNSVDSLAFLKNFGTTWDTLGNYRNMSPVNWQNEVFGKSGVTRTQNLTLMGGTNKLTYNFGYTMNDDQAIVLNSKYKRNMFIAKTDYQANKQLKLGLSGRYSVQEVLGAGVSDDKGSSYNRLRNAVKYRPFLSASQDIEALDPLADPNVGNGLNLVNPIALANAEYRKKTTTNSNITAYASYQLAKNLTLKSTFGYDLYDYVDLKFNDSITPYSVLQGSRKPITGLDTSTRKTLTNSNVLTYSLKNYKDAHDFDFLIGEETYDLSTVNTFNLNKLLPTGTTPANAFPAVSPGVPFAGYPKRAETRYTSLSFFGRINYGYKDKYLFSMNVRADGASKFAPGMQWGYFPAGSFAWRVKNEKFMESVNFISDLKVRLGYGEVGNNRINDYLYLSTFKNDGTYFYGINNQMVTGYSSAGLVNPNLQWESTQNKNIGIDISFAKRFDLSVDVYDNASKNLLLNVPIAPSFGYSTQLQNIGKTNNKGIELQLNAAIVRSKDFNWNANFNISHNVNKVVALGINQTSFYPSASWGVSGQPTDYIIKIGQPLGSFYGLVTDGFYKVSDFDYNPATSVYTLKAGVPTNVGIIGTVQPGSIKFKDLNNDGVIDLNNDRQIIGNANPSYTGGLNQQFTYKNWDFSVFVNFSYGNQVYNANKIEFTNGYTNNANLLAVMQNRWKVVSDLGMTTQWVNSANQAVGMAPDVLAFINSNAKIWMPLKSSGAFYPHSWAIEDGSFVRINNVTIGHSIDSKKLARLKISKLRFYFTGNNLAIFTKYTGYDPEVSVAGSALTPGLDYSAYPKSRTFIFGVNATF